MWSGKQPRQVHDKKIGKRNRGLVDLKESRVGFLSVGEEEELLFQVIGPSDRKVAGINSGQSGTKNLNGG